MSQQVKNVLKYKTGDVVKALQNNEINILAHGCNCFCTMGAGVAKAVRETFPEAYESDCDTISGDRKKLGSYSSVWYYSTHLFGIYNLYTQYGFGGYKISKGIIDLDYEALKESLTKMAKNILSCTIPTPDSPVLSNIKIGMPKIGAGLAGGDWEIIEDIIQCVLIKEYNLDVTIYTLD